MRLLKEVKVSIFDKTKPQKNYNAKYGGPVIYYDHDENKGYITFPHYYCWFQIDSSYWMVCRIEQSEWEDLKRKSEDMPVFIRWYAKENQEEKLYYYMYRDSFYRSEIELSENEVFLVLQTMWDSKKEKLSHELERIKAKAEFEGNLRVPVPEEVQMTVWNRDGGKCVKCGSSLNLEFDHIIPVSKGGSNTARNIQLLCEHCNRSKSANIGG